MCSIVFLVWSCTIKFGKKSFEYFWLLYIDFLELKLIKVEFTFYNMNFFINVKLIFLHAMKFFHSVNWKETAGHFTEWKSFTITRPFVIIQSHFSYLNDITSTCFCFITGKCLTYHFNVSLLKYHHAIIKKRKKHI